MPHQTIEYSANLEAELDITELIRVMHDTAANVEALPLGGLRTRAVAREYYRIADSHPDNTFINVVLRIAPGRSNEIKKDAGDILFETLTNYLESIYSHTPVAISLEIQELDAEFRWRKSNTREHMSKRIEEK
tara:strand:- start:2702 stop:3100 length:399 start_codon:yes stop_codon:yes gene_type:complete